MELDYVHLFFVVYPLEGLKFLDIFGDPGLLCVASPYKVFEGLGTI
jgi:hypothetical protein